MKTAALRRAHRRAYRTDAAVVARAPGRVNLIGDHTDYNDGLVLPMALQLAVHVAASPRTDGGVHALALDQNESRHMIRAARLGDVAKSGDWRDYVNATAWYFQRHLGAPLRGINLTIRSDLPAGAGLSSSAALMLALLRALCWREGVAWHGRWMALLAQRAESEGIGVNCGLMDQLISALGRSKRAVMIDCRDLQMTPLPLPPQVAVVAMDTATRRELAKSPFNQRRQECAAAAAALGAASLRDVSMSSLRAARRRLSDDVFRRARHVVSENDRVAAAAAALQRGDVAKLGTLFNESHRSLADDFAVTNAALDEIVAAATAHPACFGARMTGGGFGGCAVALVRDTAVDDFINVCGERYRRATGLSPLFYVCRASRGVSLSR